MVIPRLWINSCKMGLGTRQGSLNIKVNRTELLLYTLFSSYNIQCTRQFIPALMTVKHYQYHRIVFTYQMSCMKESHLLDICIIYARSKKLHGKDNLTVHNILIYRPQPEKILLLQANIDADKLRITSRIIVFAICLLHGIKSTFAPDGIISTFATRKISIFRHCSRADWFEYMVGNPENRFSRDEVHLFMVKTSQVCK